MTSAIVTSGCLFLIARTGSREPNPGGLTLESIASAVVGEVLLRGGESTVASQQLLGALLVTVLSKGMNLLHIDGYIQQIILGV
jgi:ribose transport system permease protein